MSADARIFDEYDYYSPNLEVVAKDDAFPNMARGAPGTAPWGYREPGLSDGISHAWYCHSSRAHIGYANRDEVILMANIARAYSHGAGLEVGCYYGWTTAHLAGPFQRYDVVDPFLGTNAREEIENSLRAAGVRDKCILHPGTSPAVTIDIGRAHDGPLWSFALIDGDHSFPAPLVDTVATEHFMMSDAVVVFHDVYYPPVADALGFLKSRSWKTRVCKTTNGVGIAWRGEVAPPVHTPDRSKAWKLPEFLEQHID